MVVSYTYLGKTNSPLQDVTLELPNSLLSLPSRIDGIYIICTIIAICVVLLLVLSFIRILMDRRKKKANHPDMPTAIVIKPKMVSSRGDNSKSCSKKSSKSHDESHRARLNNPSKRMTMQLNIKPSEKQIIKDENEEKKKKKDMEASLVVMDLSLEAPPTYEDAEKQADEQKRSRPSSISSMAKSATSSSEKKSLKSPSNSSIESEIKEKKDKKGSDSTEENVKTALSTMTKTGITEVETVFDKKSNTPSIMETPPVEKTNKETPKKNKTDPEKSARETVSPIPKTAIAKMTPTKIDEKKMASPNVKTASPSVNTAKQNSSPSTKNLKTDDKKKSPVNSTYINP